MPRALIPAVNALGRACEWLADLLTTAANHLKRCPDCGRSLYYGQPCNPKEA